MTVAIPDYMNRVKHHRSQGMGLRQAITAVRLEHIEHCIANQRTDNPDVATLKEAVSLLADIVKESQ